MIGFVYMWINKLNGKKYVGLHKGSLLDGYIGSGVVFRKAIEKYGIENFERIILHEEHKNEKTLYQKEFDIINELNAVFSAEYYNCTNYDPKFVKFTVGEKVRLVSLETRQKMSAIAKNRPAASEETRRKMSETRKGKRFIKKNYNQSGENNPQYGKKWYNNGSIDGIFIEGNQPPDWKLGRIRGKLFGKSNPFYGKRHSKETKEKISEKKRKRHEISKENDDN